MFLAVLGVCQCQELFIALIVRHGLFKVQEISACTVRGKSVASGVAEIKEKVTASDEAQIQGT